MKIIYFLSFLFVFSFSFAQNSDHFSVKAKYAIDSNSTWKINNLSSKTFKSFAKNNELNLGYNKNSAVWCLFKIKNNSTVKMQKTWLCFNNNHLDSVALYDTASERLLGDRTKNSSPFIGTLGFEVDLMPNEEKSFVARVKKGISFLEFSYSLENEQYLTHQANVKIALVSFFIGIIFLLILLNSILFYISKNKLYFYYLLYSVLSACYIMISSNYAKHLILTDFLYFSECRIYIASLWFICLGAFLSYFLDLKVFQPNKYRIINIVNTINCLIVIATIMLLLIDKLNFLKYFLTIGYINFLIVIVLIFWAAIAHLKIDKKSAIYVLIAFFPQLIWGLSIILKSFQLIPRNLHEDWLVLISLYEVFLFGYILAMSYIETFQKNSTLIKEIILEKENSLRAITQVQIRERRNIANIIHDNLGSKIAHISHLLQIGNTKQANESIHDLSDDIREISHKILPKSLDEGALISSLQSQIISLNLGLKNAKIEIYSYDFPEKIEEEWIHDLYLISLEIINNAIKHGLSNLVNLELYKYPDCYHFQYIDDGIGFNSKNHIKGFGLENIEKRVLHYKGTFEINSMEKQGTIIQISIPIK